MSLFCCECKCNCNCTIAAIIASVIVGVVAAFLQITGVIAVTAAFLWVVLGIAVVYLAVLVATFGLARGREGCECRCASIGALLYGILGSVLFSIILLAIGAAAVGVVGAILVALLLISFSLVITSSACLVRCIADCGD
jgi:hypothetical protein